MGMFADQNREELPSDPYEENENAEVSTDDLEDTVPEDELVNDPDEISDEDVLESDPNEERFAKFEERFEEISNKYEERIAQLEAQLAGYSEKDTNAAILNFDSDIARLKAERKEALSIGDMDAFDEIEDKLDKVKEDKAKFISENKQKQQTKPAPLPKEFVSWQKKNTWFGSDQEMTAVAMAYGQLAEKQNPNKSPAELLAIVEKKIKAKFPAYFKTPAVLNKTSNSGSRTTVTSGGKSYSDLPRDAKIACDEMVAEGRFKNRNEYVKMYFEQD